MRKNTLARARLDGAGWAHPYGHGPFSPIVYADGGDGGGSGSGDGGSGDGGSGGSGSPGGSGSGTGDQGGRQSGQGGQQSGQPGSDPWTGFQWDGKVDSLPPDVAKVIREAREEAGKSRTVAKQNAAEEARKELLATISKAVGLDAGPTPPTPEELTRQLTQSQSALTAAQEQAASAALELHVYRTASRMGADADALLDSRSFCDRIDSIDPSGKPEDFNKAVEDAITEALDANPLLRAGRVPRRGGGDFPGGPGTSKRPTSLHDAIAAKLGG
ncbi:hypothetical protein [Streptomyces sp. MMS20-AI2-20]|uniref:hypothetical protein n=1 Tax=Streptomyces sp. MMS20-AI2-20 TaxID=2925835 RepID=UPI001F610DA6|nr:hypothetical protein [Streptomyces sp. MMS20-AI2-20]MCI4143053.1 hypothetical protein [Streptomyces sp. MMS20-AI2-20]